jgi:hypothetical protein
MNENESKPLSDMSGEATLPELRQQLESFRTLFVVTLVGLLIISAFLNLYLLRQWITVRKEAASIKQTLAAHQQHTQVFQGIVGELQNYARTHPDYLPILQKHGMVAAPAGNQKP